MLSTPTEIPLVLGSKRRGIKTPTQEFMSSDAVTTCDEIYIGESGNLPQRFRENHASIAG